MAELDGLNGSGNGNGNSGNTGGGGGSGALPSHLLHLATLHILTRSASFSHAKSLPLHVLSNLVQDYIQLLATTAKHAAESAGRHNVNIWDLASALDEFGTASLQDLKQELENSSDSGGHEAQRLRSVALGLRDYLDPPGPRDPVARLGFHPLADSELHEIATIQAYQPPPEASFSAGESDEEDELKTPPPLPPDRELLKLERADLFDFDSLPPVSAWRDPNLIPSYVPDFLPPFPGMEKDLDVPEPVRRRKEREREQREQAVQTWVAPAGGSDEDPWAGPIPYSSSSFNSLNPPPVLPPLSPPPSPGRKRRRSLSPPQRSSLARYKELAASINEPAPVPRINSRRRIAAASISVSADLSLASDSMFGNVPVIPFRQSLRAPGYISEDIIHTLHPFNSLLPHTVGYTVPTRPSPHAALIAPHAHPRIPTIMQSISASLSKPTGQNLTLFNRLTRMGPPGPLGNNGEAEAYDYDFSGEVRRIPENVEWEQRPYNHRLVHHHHHNQQQNRGPGGGGGHGHGWDTGGGEADGSGIRLSLRLGKNGSVPASNAGSPAPGATPGPSNGWGSYTGGALTTGPIVGSPAFMHAGYFSPAGGGGGGGQTPYDAFGPFPGLADSITNPDGSLDTNAILEQLDSLAPQTPALDWDSTAVLNNGNGMGSENEHGNGSAAYESGMFGGGVVEGNQAQQQAEFDVDSFVATMNASMMDEEEQAHSQGEPEVDPILDPSLSNGIGGGVDAG
ncbi:hypothetical protein T439DRAFT_323997 [Meredithblackwellia eburnea MCA 4105]